jgi:hypothetical protein
VNLEVLVPIFVEPDLHATDSRPELGCRLRMEAKQRKTKVHVVTR